MKVLLIQDVYNLGMAGDVKEVANGYGQNYLIPKGLAVLATPGAMKKADLHRRRAAERRQRLADEIAILGESVRQATLVFQAKAGEKGRLYGSVTTAEIADKLAETIGREVDRRKLAIESPIKELGTHKVELRLSADVVAEFDVIVESLEDAAADEEAVPDEEAASDEEAAPVEAEEPVAEE
jgi:large subunit ribosomal protein L9